MIFSMKTEKTLQVSHPVNCYVLKHRNTKKIYIVAAYFLKVNLSNISSDENVSFFYKCGV